MKYSKVSWAEHVAVMHVQGMHRLGRKRKLPLKKQC